MLNKILLIIFASCFFSNIQGQQIKIIDSENKLPIPNVHICTESADKLEVNYWVTDTEGIIKNTLKKKAKVAISFIGYRTLVDSIEPNKSYTFKLQPKTESINEVVVTGQIKPETVDKSIYNIQVINSKQIENKAANNLGDLLTNELNVSVSNSGILGTTIQMQGLSGEHIKILIDGIPVIGRQNGNIDLNQLNLNNVDHIEIVEGPMSVIYGSNALAGAINIITKKNIRPKYSVGLNTYYESVGVYNIDGSLDANIKKHHIGISGGRNFFNGYSYNDAEQRTYNFSPKEQYTGSLVYGYNTKKLQLTLTQELFQEKLINYGSLYYTGKIIIDTTTYSIPMANDDYHKTIRANTKGDFNYSLSEKSKISFMAAYSYYEKRKNTYHKNLYYLTEELIADTAKHDTTFFYAVNSRASYTTLLNKFELQGGYDLIIETGNGKRITDTKRIDDYAGFFSLKYTPLSTLSFQGGARFIYNTKFDAPIVYSINSKWDPINNLNIRASYGKGFRSPSIKELYLDFTDINHEVKGNENLKAEYSENYNLSFKYKFEITKHGFNTSLKFYHNKIKNKIDFLYDSINSAKADYTNIDGLYKTIGGQFDVTYKLHPRLELKAGINYYGQSKIAKLSEYTYTPDFIASFNYHNVAHQFRINLYYKYNGKQSQFYEGEKDGETIIEESYIAPYGMMDLAINKPFLNSKVTASTGIKNILNVKSVDGSGGNGTAHSGDGDGGSSIAWGRTFFLKLSLNINKF